MEINYPIDDVWRGNDLGTAIVDKDRFNFEVTCKNVEGIDTVTFYNSEGNVDLYSKYKKFEKEIIDRVCPLEESYADSRRFIMELGYLQDYTKPQVCSLPKTDFNNRELRLLERFCGVL